VGPADPRIASIVNAKGIEAGLGGVYRGRWAEEGWSVAREPSGRFIDRTVDRVEAGRI
jgi:hypothetical protein